MLSYESALAAVVVLVPLMLIAAYLDLKYLRLPNWLALACLAAFLIIAIGDIMLNERTGMRWSLIGWRLLYALIVMVVGFLAFSLGLVGGGDVKMLAALVPFVAETDVSEVLVLYCIAAIVGVLGVWLLSYTKIGERTGWATWTTRNKRGRLNFPWGVALAATMLVYSVARLLSYPQLAAAPT